MNTIAMAPTCLPHTPPLEYVAAAAAAGFQAIGFRLHKSPVYPNWESWLGNASLKRDVKRAVEDAGIQVVDALSFYLQPDMDLDGMLPAFEYAAELGAGYVLVIGDDSEWGRMVDGFGRLCDSADRYGLVAVIEAPVRSLWPLSQAVTLIAESGRQNAGICIDPLNFLRAGDVPATLRTQNPRLFPYMQLNDGPNTPDKQCICPGEGEVPLYEMLDILPAGQTLSLEYWQDEHYSARDWASKALTDAQGFLERYRAARS